MQLQGRIFLLLWLWIPLLQSSELLKLEGYLREIQEGENKRYVLFPATPTEILLPNGLIRHISFVLLEMADEYLSCMGKYVMIEGKWKGMDSPIFDDIAILNVEYISDNHWTNAEEVNEAMHDFFDEHMPVIAEGASAVARWQALKLGFTLLEVEDSWLIEVSPDGTKTRARPLAGVK